MSRSLVPMMALLIVAGCHKSRPQLPANSIITSKQVNESRATQRERTADEVALLEASGKGEFDTVKSLLARGVDPNAGDAEGRTPLTEAAYYGHTEIVKLLVNGGADMFAKKKDGQTPVTMAGNHKDIADFFADSIHLLELSGKEDTGAVKALVDKGANVNVKDPDGRTPLTEAVWANNLNTVKLLLAKGADPNARKKDGATPLSIATNKGYKEIVEALKMGGAKGSG